MKYYTLEEIIKVIQKMLEHGWGEIVIHVRDHKVARYDKKESHEPRDDPASQH